MKRSIVDLIAAALVATFAIPAGASAQTPPASFPPDASFAPVGCFDPTLTNAGDSCTDDARDHRNIIGGNTRPAYQIFQDGSYLYLRLRVEDDPRQGNAFVAFAWGFGIDVDGDGAFEAYVSLIGQGNNDRVEVLDQDPGNGTTPDLTLPTGGGTDTSLRPVVTDGSGPTWATATSAGASFCADDAPPGDWFITVAVPLTVLQRFGAIGGSVAYGGSSSEFSGIQNDSVCTNGRPTSCITGTQCPSGVCLTGVGQCAPPVGPVFLGCVNADVNGDQIDDGCSASTPVCLVGGGTSRCVQCELAAECNDGNSCTSDACVSNACVRTPIAAGSTCSGGVCNGSASAPACVSCIDDRTGTTRDSGCTAGAPVCNTSGPAPFCAGCTTAADCNDGNACTADACNAGICARTPIAAGSACSGGVCNGSASEPACVECVDSASGSSVDSGCTAGEPYCDTSGAAPSCAACVTDVDCNDGNACTTDTCSAAGTCSSSSVALGTACAGGICNGSTSAPACVGCVDDVAGSGRDTGCAVITPFCTTSSGTAQCVACVGEADCNDGNACTADSCVAGTCVATSRPVGTSCAGGVCNGASSAPACVTCVDSSSTSTDLGCAGGAPFCDASGASPVCVECLGATDCDDGLECTIDACTSGACSASAAAEGTTCTGGVCDGTLGVGACVDCVDDRTGALIDSGCAAATPRCDETTRTCVQCFAAADCDDGNACTADACSATGACSATPIAAGTTCGGGVCNGASTGPECVVCVDDAAGTTQDTGCTAGAPVCDTSGATPVCTGCLTAADCDDGNACTSDACVAGVCTPTSLAAGTTCTGGVCDGEAITPECVACVDDAANPSADSGCRGSTPFCDTSGASPVCVGCTGATDCDDGNECTTDACTAGACSATSRAMGSPCSAGVCDGASTPACVLCIDDASGAAADSGCSGAAALCDTSAATRVCVACLDSGDALDDGCAAPDEVCVASAGTNVCVTCADTMAAGGLDFGCAEGAPLCVTRAGAFTCVECVDDSTCDAGDVCNVAVGACARGCTDASDCAAPTPVCDTGASICVECLVDDDCAGREVCADGNVCEPPDHDGDGVPDDVDLDDDDDGVPDADELGGSDRSLDSDDDGIADFEDPDAIDCADTSADGICDELPSAVDFDGDGVPNHLDLDADGDGLTDLVEAGGADANGDGRVDGLVDVNGNGLDDRLMASPLPLPNSDGEGGPDFLDVDADGDSVPDAIEGSDADHDGEADISASGRDVDRDGLDDAFDPDQGGDPASRPDTDGDGTSDWRDPDDDGDDVPTIDEDADGDDDPTNDDSDGDGTPDYLDPHADVTPSGGFSGGALCAVRSGASDPSLAFAMLLAALVLVRRRARR